MDLSIIIVNWNTRQLLGDCLRSIYASKPLARIEVIVVDNGSKDGSQHMVRKLFPQVVLLEMTHNLGFARANNVGFGAAKGAYVLMLNSDTIVHKKCLDRCLQHMRMNPRVAAMGCLVLNPDGSRQRSASRFPTFSELVQQTLGLKRLQLRLPTRASKANSVDAAAPPSPVEVISGCFLMISRFALSRVGPLDEDFFFFGEETDWCKRARDKGFKLHFRPVGSIVHFGGGSSAPLRFHRDLMLTKATVRLNLKHHGYWAARRVYWLLFLFNISRAGYWSLLDGLRTAPNRRKRAVHFNRIVDRYSDAWPS